MSYWKNYWNTSQIVKKANPHSQVGRTVFGTPIESKNWDKTIQFLSQKLDLKENDVLLDLCCGNGLLSIPFSQTVKQVYSIDFSEPLITHLRSQKIRNIQALHADINALKWKKNSVDKAIIYFAIQHFTEEETVHLLQKLYKWLKDDGKIYIGDIPNTNKIWTFFYKKEYRAKFFESIEKGKPIIGNWFSPEFFVYLTEYLGFKDVQIIKQKQYMINHKYRFDVLISK